VKDDKTVQDAATISANEVLVQEDEGEVFLSTGVTEEQKELIEKLDKEAQVRSFKNPGIKKFIYVISVLISLYHLYTSVLGPPVTLKHRSLHVAMMLLLAFVLYPLRKKSSFKDAAWYDWGFAILSCAVPIYVWTNYLGVIERAGNPNTMDTVIATLLVLLVLEGTRRVSGLPLPVLSLVFIAYGIFGRGLPGMFGHRGYTWVQLGNHFMANTEGIYGTSVSVAASYIFLFILFGAVMNKSGMGQFFNDIAMALAGHTKGGPAKVAVIASGLLGMINGSAIANVVTTGAFTIPLMKKSGYSKEFSGAVSATGSVGGQLLPPVMGAAAFIMAEMLGVKYSVIAISAAIPAVLYYLGIIVQVHLRASKMNFMGVEKEKLPKTRDVMKERGHLLIPIVFLMCMLFFSGTTVIFSAFWTIVLTVVVAAFRKTTRMSLRDIIDALEEGARSTVPVALACACVGIVVGVSSKTGFGLSLANTIITLGKMNLLFTLVFTMITCMILGMGLPSIPAYIITAAVAAPALVKLGVPDMAAHMFAFYFAMFANLTPPVALAAFAAAGLSGGDPMKTGWASVKLALAGFIVPFMFIYSPQLLLINTGWMEGIRVAITSLIGVFLISVAVEGYLFTKAYPIIRMIAAASALCLINSSLLTDIVGIVLLAIIIIVQKMLAKKPVGTMA